MSAVRDAAVSRNPVSCIFFLDLTWEIHSAQESSEVARQCHKRNREGFDRQAVARQNSFVTPTRSQVDKKHDPDQQAGSTSKDQVHQENSFEPLPFKLPLPGENAGNHDWNRNNCRSQQIAIRRSNQNLPFRPMRREIKGHARNEQGDRKMYQDHVLRVFRQQRCFDVEGMQGFSSLTAR